MVGLRGAPVSAQAAFVPGESASWLPSLFPPQSFKFLLLFWRQLRANLLVEVAEFSTHLGADGLPKDLNPLAAFGKGTVQTTHLFR